MARKRAHKGVSIIKPRAASRTGWRLRFIDPDAGRMKWESIDTTVYRTARDREDLAVRKAEEIANRKRELDQGATPFSNTTLGAAIERFYRTHPLLGERTHETYQLGTDRLLEWAGRNRIETTDDLTRGKLVEFQAEVVAAPRQYSGNQGGKVKAGTRRSPATVNKELRAVSRVLGHLIDADKCARLSHDDLRRALKQVKAPTERREFLRPNELRKLFEACRRHDAEVYRMTRTEKDNGTMGSTARYEAVSALVALTLLTGMRFGEVLALRWKDVDLDALDHNGRPVGEIYVRGKGAKTSKHRDIGLEVSPACRKLLAVMRLQSGGRGLVVNVSKDGAIKAMRRLRTVYGAPAKFSYQALRVTCSTFLTNSPGIHGGASAFMAAKQLGHSVAIAEKHYAGLLRGIDPKHGTLEAAMQIEKQVEAVIERTDQRRAA
jgi:integrase